MHLNRTPLTRQLCELDRGHTVFLSQPLVGVLFLTTHDLVVLILFLQLLHLNLVIDRLPCASLSLTPYDKGLCKKHDRHHEKGNGDESSFLLSLLFPEQFLVL